MTNTFIRLSGKNIKNRASIITQVHTSLSLAYEKEKDMLCSYILHNDLISVFDVNGERVGLVSHQNPSQEVIELVEQLIQKSCSVILFTSVNSELSNEHLNSMLRQHNYKIINLLPFWSGAMEFDYLAQVEVENIIELVEMLTEKKPVEALAEKKLKTNPAASGRQAFLNDKKSQGTKTLNI
jgi:hypothetical protein